MLTASIVINTFNRADSLRITLEGLALLDYPLFEVIVVNGPSTDQTSDVLASWGTRIKTVQTDQRNLSVSRNLGVAAASGEIVAFIDDDAYPDPAWLDCIVAAYDRDEIAGAGGPVYDHTGVTFQTFYIISDRSGASWNEWPPMVNPTEMLSHPYSPKYPSLLGTNSSFRRRNMVEIGGFDEEFEYYLDETDVCLRLIDRGYVIRALDQGFVYHKFLASHLRTEKRVLRNRYSVIKNRLYFALRHGIGDWSLYDIWQDAFAFVDYHRQEVRWSVEHGMLTEADSVAFEADVRRAFDTAFSHARDNASIGQSPSWFSKRQSPFLPFRTRRPRAGKLHVCFFSQEYPPVPVGGIGRFTHELAVGLAELGHHVHVLTRGQGHSTVDLEDGVWVHRVVASPHPAPADVKVPPAIWDYSASLYDEALRIHAHRPLDVIEVPLWDSEGIAAILDGAVTTVLSLHTPLPVALEFNPHWLDDPVHRESHIEPLKVLERVCLERSSFVLANSNAVVKQIAVCHDIALDDSRLAIIPHGLGETPTTAVPPARTGIIDVLYVGRLENRKGIDVLLAAAPALLTRFPTMQLTVVGDDSLPAIGKSTHRQAFEESADPAVRQRVHFTGVLSDADVERHYAACDIVVMPSRYESFGLVLLEAMRYGKPIVSSDIGGISEVIRNGETGLLVPPGDATVLEAAIASLAADATRRQRLGQAAFEAFKDQFTRSVMAKAAEDLYRRLAIRRHDLDNSMHRGRHLLQSAVLDES